MPASRTDRNRPMELSKILELPVRMEGNKMPRDMSPISIPRNICAITMGKPPYDPCPIMKSEDITGMDMKRFIYIPRRNCIKRKTKRIKTMADNPLFIIFLRDIMKEISNDILILLLD
jgi:hypothetical protein